MTSTFEQEVKRGERFQFGKNWSNFLSVLDDERIGKAENSLKQSLQVEDLQGKSFLDIGSGSGLFSLAARRLGATVHSFDYDPQAVVCTQQLKNRFFSDDKNWLIEKGSILDSEYLNGLSQFDIVYSWGVLHHTGSMWQALENAGSLVAMNGKLFIAIYNDQGWKSQYWKIVKKQYNQNKLLRPILTIVHIPFLLIFPLIWRLLIGRFKGRRGMSAWFDLIDWIGGYPFEVAKPEEVHNFFEKREFKIVNHNLCLGKMGCNEFIFQKQ
ncbi:bifunctional 2-polyprenyl-6-hydroxyphenol methylase/3-demethylubiquinol 3-O-methyltransferase UbiG [[Phormidium] sp. ETS-05]|uniref:class I SAM-dependent methyltransferase n=1 Tax=[Phormidium] sp. ETS-05 TaxID=222819 RepID=UPI0018EECAD5|nr:class I SAM-dependent methyltransferase [[Phormidium] sp. ETS-05]